MPATLVSLNVGSPESLAFQGKAVQTGIFKRPVAGPRALSSLGIEGDQQADRTVHGGPDKVACVYPVEHWPYWSERLDKVLGPGSFGENFSVREATEETVCLGDIYRVGASLLQVSQPRQPCFKLATRHGEKKLALWVQERGWTGYYFRCLEPGVVQAGDSVSLVERSSHGVTILEANRVMHRDQHDHDGIRRILAVPELGAAWRSFLEHLLTKGQDLALYRKRIEGEGAA